MDPFELIQRLDNRSSLIRTYAHKGADDCRCCDKRMSKFEADAIMRWCHGCKRMVRTGDMIEGGWL